MVIGDTALPHKPTWVSPDHTTGSQIANIFINKQFRKSVEDMRTKRIDIPSGHHLDVAKIKVKLKNH
ncbi:unnamed protein product [Schistosoma margrebowiei]|uniref:Uncharacterized protein n=1 Tax=Schistosoma margrebowiei TaxID=48269 RepID=A0A183LAZ2_9TREM|nr:unnamed protein product [Schistosoma margrebowiei]